MDIATILKYLGEFGPFQKLVFVLVGIIQWFVGIHTLANVFLMGEPIHRCFIPQCDNSSSQYYEHFTHFAIPNVTDEKGKLVRSSCLHYARIEGDDSCLENSFNRSVILTCKSYIWDKADFESTTISEFNIVCDRSWDQAFSSSFFMVGYLIGSFGFGMISDRYGRKTVIILASLMLLFSSTSTAFSVSFIMFTIFRFVTAVAVCGLVQAGYILAVEFMSPSKRLICSSIIGSMFSVGELILGLSAFYIRKWRMLELSVAIPGIILLLYYWLLPESLRWLMSNGKHERSKKIILTAAKWNKVKLSEEEILAVTDCLTVNDDSSKVSRVGPLDLIHTPRLRMWTLNLVFNWTVNTMVYYGLALNAGHLYGDIYVNFSLLALVEIPTVLITLAILVHTGPRRILCVMMVLGSLACGVTVFVPESLSWVSVLFTFLGRIAISSSFSVIYLFSSEIFPTVLRNTGIGLCSTFGRIGAICAPIIMQLGETYHYLPMLIFSIALMVSGLLTLALPETHNRHLPDTVEEAENFGLQKTMPTYPNLQIEEEEPLLSVKQSVTYNET